MGAICAVIRNSMLYACEQAGRCMGAIYAVIRNGMWDDSAVAGTGSIARKFQSKVSPPHFRSQRVAPYLTWRFCYLLCAVVFGLARLIVNWFAVQNVEHEYLTFIEKQLPPAVSLDNFKKMASFLAHEDIAVWIMSLVSFGFMIGGVCTAAPSFALTQTTLSRRLIWISWFVAFIPPFVIFLICPIRSFVDWNKVTADVCIHSIHTTLGMPGSELRRSMIAAGENDLIDNVLDVVSDTDAWCVAKGADWHDAFFNTFVSCSWRLDDSCRDQICTGLSSDFTSCLMHCMTYATTQYSGPKIRNNFLGTMRLCINGSQKFNLGPPRGPPAADSDPRQQLTDMYHLATYAQRKMVVESSEAVTLASIHAEYVVGLLIAMITGKYLLPACLSLLGGFAEALVNKKAMFPDSQAGGWILILTTGEAVPVYIAVLAIFQQILGDWLLAVAGILVAMYVSLGIFTGQRMLFLKNGDAQREVLYRQIWIEYTLRMALGVGILVVIVVWDLRKQTGLMEYVANELFTTKIVVSTVLDVVTKKIVTAVAGTDLVTSAFVQAEMWQFSATTDERQTHEEDIRDIAKLMWPSTNEAPVPLETKQSGDA